MDPRPRQLLAQYIEQYGLALCDQAGRCRGLLQDDLQGACEAEVNLLFLVQQHGIVHNLRAAAQAAMLPATLLMPQLLQKLRRKVPLEEAAARWAIEAWAEALKIPLPPASPPSIRPPRPRPSPVPPPVPQAVPLAVPDRKKRWFLLSIAGLFLLLGGFIAGRWSTPRPPGSSWSNRLGMAFVLIPAGAFQMGSNSGDNDEKPTYQVRISRSFYLGRYEVTQAQWQEVMGENPSWFKGDKHPVESVSWDDVQRFVQRLNARESGQRYRLPTEAEWEYAVRGSDRRTYPWGNRFDGARLNFCDRNCTYSWNDENADDGYATTAPVGSYAGGQSPFGVYDMAGNVWEWVQDWYGSDAYQRGSTAGVAAVDPAGPTAGSSRVTRGGSWRNDSGGCRAADRGRAGPGARYGYLGFRLLREVP